MYSTTAVCDVIGKWSHTTNPCFKGMTIINDVVRYRKESREVCDGGGQRNIRTMFAFALPIILNQFHHTNDGRGSSNVEDVPLVTL